MCLFRVSVVKQRNTIWVEELHAYFSIISASVVPIIRGSDASPEKTEGGRGQRIYRR